MSSPFQRPASPLRSAPSPLASAPSPLASASPPLRSASPPLRPAPSPRSPSPLSEVVAPALNRHHTLIDSVATWARSNADDLQIDRELLALVLLGKEEFDTWCPAAATRGHYWTRTQINHVLSIDIPNLCSKHAVRRPEGAAQQLWLLIAFLDAEHLLHFDSDTIDRLRGPMHCYAGLDAHGHKAEKGAAPLAPCRCYWPTRKQLDLGLEQPPPPMPDAFDWYAPERAAVEAEWADDAEWRRPLSPPFADAS